MQMQSSLVRIERLYFKLLSNMNSNNSKNSKESVTLAKSKSTQEIKSSESLLFSTLNSIQSCTNIHAYNKQPLIELPIEQQLCQNSSVYEYYALQATSKRVSFAQEKQTVSEMIKLPSQRKRSSSILKNGSLSKNIRSPSRTSIGLDQSVQKQKTPISGSHLSPIVIKKFKSILLGFEPKKGKTNNQKFTDSIFPPIYSSLFTVNSSSTINRIGSEIVWKRIPQLITTAKLVLMNKGHEQSNMFAFAGKYSSQYFASVVNAIKNCESLINQFFRDHIANDYGVYCMRIFTENGWRNIIIDDFVPAIKEGQSQRYAPAFINIKQLNGNSYRGGFLQIWPFLLEKAYANYYSTYEAIKYGNVSDFLQEVTGCMLAEEQPKVDENKRNILRINIDDKKQARTKWMEFQRLRYKISKVISTKQKENKIRPDVFVRRVLVSSCMDLSIMVRQKDERFYHHSAIFYKYIWNRVIILYKDYGETYSWIDGHYSNAKAISFSLPNARPGEYYILIMPQWKSIHRNQISVIVSSNKDDFQIDTIPYCEEQKMIEKGCSDLAQRQGNLQQLNKITCSYQYIHLGCSLIIESIHNERIIGEIVVQRDWKTNKMSLVPFNSQFCHGKGKGKVQVLIQKNSQYTFVILEVNGKNNQLQQYTF